MPPKRQTAENFRDPSNQSSWNDKVRDLTKHMYHTAYSDFFGDGGQVLVKNRPKSASDHVGYQGHVGNIRFPLLSRNSSASSLRQDPDTETKNVSTGRPYSALSRYRADFQGVQKTYPTRQNTPGISRSSAMSPPFALAPSFRPERPESAPMLRPSRSEPGGLFTAGADISGRPFPGGRQASGRPIYGFMGDSRPLSAVVNVPGHSQEKNACCGWHRRLQH